MFHQVAEFSIMVHYKYNIHLVLLGLFANNRTKLYRLNR